ncbi:MAG: hypothetical protein AAGL24_21200 [Pseudomonadota bacterium]
MALDGVLITLQARDETHQRAREFGQLGLMQRLGSLPGNGDFRREAIRAYARARHLRETDPAASVLGDPLIEAMRDPLRPLDPVMPRPMRRGARARRSIR